MNNIFEPFSGLFSQIFIDDFGVYGGKTSHLTKLQLVFQYLDGFGVILSLKNTTIGF